MNLGWSILRTEALNIDHRSAIISHEVRKIVDDHLVEVRPFVLQLVELLVSVAGFLFLQAAVQLFPKILDWVKLRRTRLV